ncbi:MAG: biotin/lipoyl-containing protein [Pedobacter sp.]|nr:biotin/lipoyl-containing protein [Pedobacter sp.]MDQ8052824.1 biotin/lipoyl-containing protein [Pedobacter sp.]
MYQVKVNDKFDFEVEASPNELIVNKETVNFDQVVLNANSSNVLYKNKSYHVEVVAFSAAEKTAALKINGTVYQVQVKDQFDQLLKQLGLDNLTTNKILQLKAPMPGLVLNVLVNAGDEVKKGDNLLVLEAMKMENMIKSPTDGTIKQVAVKQGDKVEKNELLISFN